MGRKSIKETPQTHKIGGWVCEEDWKLLKKVMRNTGKGQRELVIEPALEALKKMCRSSWK
jgi:hypothetical protein